MKIHLVGALAVACAMLISCGGSETGSEQEPTPSAQPKPAGETKPASEVKPVGEAEPAQEPVVRESVDNPPKGDTEIEKKAYAAITRFKDTDPRMTRFFDGSKGYAVFPKVGKGGLIVGGAHGQGVVYERSASGTKIIGYSELTQGSIGLQAGGQVFSEIIFFETEAALESFKKGTTEFAGTASAVAASAGASVDAAYEAGVAVFTAGESGLMLQASIGGQGFSFEPKG
jgi:lipid-binding SYLF domain-containing protein